MAKKTSEEENPIRLTREEEEMRPMRLIEAERYLKLNYPRYFRTAKELGRLCEKHLIPHVAEPQCGVTRKVRYLVRIKDLMAKWKTYDRPA